MAQNGPFWLILGQKWPKFWPFWSTGPKKCPKFGLYWPNFGQKGLKTSLPSKKEVGTSLPYEKRDQKMAKFNHFWPFKVRGTRTLKGRQKQAYGDRFQIRLKMTKNLKKPPVGLSGNWPFQPWVPTHGWMTKTVKKWPKSVIFDTFLVIFGQKVPTARARANARTLLASAAGTPDCP